MPQKGPASFPLTILTLTLHLFRLRVASQLHLNNFESPLHHLTSARLQDDTRQNASLWMSQLVSPWEGHQLALPAAILFNGVFTAMFTLLESMIQRLSGSQLPTNVFHPKFGSESGRSADGRWGLLGIISLKFQGDHHV